MNNNEINLSSESSSCPFFFSYFNLTLNTQLKTEKFSTGVTNKYFRPKNAENVCIDLKRC